MSAGRHPRIGISWAPVGGADPVYQGSGTLYYSGATAVSSMSTTITNVQAGDLLIVQCQREFQGSVQTVQSAQALSFSRQIRANSTFSGFENDTYAAIATEAVSSMVITATYSNSASWGSIISHRWGSGVSSATALASNADTSLRSSSVNRTCGNITTTQRSLLIAAGADWDYYRTHTPAENWSKALDSQTKGTDSTSLFMHYRVADAGTYPNGNFATTNDVDQYFGGIAAFPIGA
jgi:hypothetical protein